MPRDDAHLVVEITINDFCLPGVIVEVLLLAGDFKMAAARQVAGDHLFANDLFDAVDGGQRSSVHALREFASVPGDEFVDPQLHAAEDHASIAGTGTPAAGFGFEHGDSSPALGEGPGGREASESRADHGYVGDFREGAGGFGCGELSGGEPVVSFLQGHGRGFDQLTESVSHRGHRGLRSKAS